MKYATCFRRPGADRLDELLLVLFKQALAEDAQLSLRRLRFICRELASARAHTFRPARKWYPLPCKPFSVAFCGSVDLRPQKHCPSVAPTQQSVLAVCCLCAHTCMSSTALSTPSEPQRVDSRSSMRCSESM